MIWVKENGITLISLVITIIVLLILAGVTISLVTEGNILGNASEAVEQDKISKVQYELQEEVVKIATSGVREISMEKLIERLENKGVIVLGNTVNGQVITEEGYIFEIKLKAYGDIEVNYIGKGDLPEGTTLILTPNTTGIASKVTITVKGVSTEGIKSYTPPTGTAKTYSNTPRTINETYEVTENGTYTFKVTDSKNNEITESITISNILAGTIQMSANKTTPTKDDVIVTITWPSNTGNGPKQVKVGEGVWQTVTGATSELTIKENCTVRAKVSNSIGEMIGASITVNNIDKTLPTISTENTVIVDYKTDKNISEYFTVTSNGIADVTDIIYVDTSNENVSVENTNTLTIGTHIIQCVATKETGAMSSETMTIIVEPNVYGNLYKISDTEYHLIFNGTGEIAEGYTESQLVVRSANIKDGCGEIQVSESEWISDQPWAQYADNITTVKVVEELKPRSTAWYFFDLSKITEIEGLGKIDTSNVTNMRCMFSESPSLISLDLSGYDTSKVTNMSNMFSNSYGLTSIDINGFDTKNVTDMHSMFNGCNNLISLDVSGFNTSNVTNMYGMFNGCKSLNNIDTSKFDTKNVTDMHNMFWNCNNLTSIDISGFNTKNVTNMSHMFGRCDTLKEIDVSGFDTENVTNMYRMFFLCSSLNNLDVSGFNTGNVTSMESMFHGCGALTNIDVSGFTTANVTNMYCMFFHCGKLTSVDISGFNTENVTNMESMFNGCSSLTSVDVSSFNTANVTNMAGMFNYCTNLTTIYAGENWTTSALIENSNMFRDSTKLKGAIAYDSTKIDANYANWTTGYLIYKANIGVYGNLYKKSDTEYHLIFNSTGAIADGYTNSELVVKSTNIKNGAGRLELSDGSFVSDQPWEPYSANITKVKIVEEIKPRSTAHYFRGLTAITEIEGIGNIDTSNVTSMWCMFMKCSSITNLDVSGFNTEKVTSMESMFNECSSLTNLNVSNFNTSNVTTMHAMFEKCSSLASLDVSNFNTENVTTMYKMFNGCSGLASLDVSNFNTENVTTMYWMFDGCGRLTSLDVTNFDTSNVTDMYAMFYGCSSLTSLDVSGFDTSNVTNMRSMFYQCSGLTSLNVTNFYTKNVTNMRSMFFQCSGLTSLDVSGFDTSNVTDMGMMFDQMSKLTSLDVSNFDTSNVTDMYAMFYMCSNLQTIYAGENWTTSAVTESSSMFQYSTKLKGAIAYDSTKLDANYANWTTGYLTYKSS